MIVLKDARLIFTEALKKPATTEEDAPGCYRISLPLPKPQVEGWLTRSETAIARRRMSRRVFRRWRGRRRPVHVSFQTRMVALLNGRIA